MNDQYHSLLTMRDAGRSGVARQVRRRRSFPDRSLRSLWISALRVSRRCLTSRGFQSAVELESSSDFVSCHARFQSYVQNSVLHFSVVPEMRVGANEISCHSIVIRRRCNDVAPQCIPQNVEKRKRYENLTITGQIPFPLTV